ncbi:MAG: dephospho-CoA kinase [Sedimentitalea sp.]
MSFALGLTGSIGMGKSTTAKMFSELGCAVWDADAAVHRLYAPGGGAVEPMRAVFPTAIIDGGVDRNTLKQIIATNPDALKQIETIVHPLVGQDRTDFRAAATSDILVFDIPLLFETGGEARVDAVACVSIDAQTQEARVMARGTMTKAQFEQIKQKQMPDGEKRTKADYIIITDTESHAREQVQAIVSDIRKGLGHA